MSDDFPLPETPVIQVRVPSGISKSTFFKLFPEALVSEIVSPLPLRLSFEKGIEILPLRYFDVVLLPFRNVVGSP